MVQSGRAGYAPKTMTQSAYLSGQFLLAMPGMADARFDHAVIAMCSHDGEGALGIGIGATIEGLGLHDLLDVLLKFRCFWSFAYAKALRH